MTARPVRPSLMAAFIFALCLLGLSSVAEAQSPDPAERAASAAEATQAAAEQGRDWLVAGLLGAAIVAGFAAGQRLV